MSADKIKENEKCKILPFVKKAKEYNNKNNSSMALLVAIDVSHTNEEMPDELLTKLIEKKFEATVLHVEYIDAELTSETKQIVIKSINDNHPN